MDNHLQFWFLRNHDVLKRLSEAQLIELNTIAEFKRAEKDEHIYSFDQEIDKIYFLCRGRIKIAFSIDQNLEVVAEILKDGDVFGELTLKKSFNKHSEFARVLSNEAFICSFSLKEFENFLN